MGKDIKQMVDEVVNKAKSNPNFMEDLKKNPEKAIESVIGIDIPDGMVDKVMDAIKAKGAADAISGLMSKIGK